MIAVALDRKAKADPPPANTAAMMKPYAGAVEAWEVAAEVGKVRNNRPELMDRIGLL